MTERETFNASNGSIVDFYPDRSFKVANSHGLERAFRPSDGAALAEVFQRKRDAEFGRSRDMVIYDMVIYDKGPDGQPMSDSGGRRVIRVLDENTGASVVMGGPNGHDPQDRFRAAAQRWFAANPSTPPPKPGEVWLVGQTPWLVTPGLNLRNAQGDLLTPTADVMARATRIHPAGEQ